MQPAGGFNTTGVGSDAGMTQRNVIVEPEPFECVPHGLLLDTQVSANTLRVYLILRKHRDYETGKAWPGLTRIGELIGISSRTVQRCISELVTTGYVCVEARFNEYGGRTSNLYHVHFDRAEGCDFFGPSDTDVATPTTPKSPSPATPVSTEPIPSTNKTQGNEVKTSSPTHFDAFWDAYPRKKGKGQARTAWARAAKKADPSLIIHGAIQYRQWCQQDGTEAQFIAHPSTWLNGERWTDERDPTPLTKAEARSQGHIALIQELWETENGYPQDKPLQLEG